MVSKDKEGVRVRDAPLIEGYTNSFPPIRGAARCTKLPVTEARSNRFHGVVLQASYSQLDMSSSRLALTLTMFLQSMSMTLLTLKISTTKTLYGHQALNPEVDWKALEETYLRNEPVQLAYVDDFFSEAALAILLDMARSSTIYFETRYGGLGLELGLASGIFVTRALENAVDVELEKQLQIVGEKSRSVMLTETQRHNMLPSACVPAAA